MYLTGMFLNQKKNQKVIMMSKIISWPETEKMREIKLPKRYAYADLITFLLTASQGIETDKPKTYSEAVSSKDLEKWMAAMDEEMQSLIKNHT